MRNTNFSIIKRWFGIVLLSSCLFFMGGVVFDALAFNGSRHVELPAQTGAYGVGTAALPLVDDARLEEMTPEPDDFREIMVQIWYPTDKNASGPTVPYMDLPSLSYLIVQSIGIFMQSEQETDTDPSAALENPIRGDEFSNPIVSAPRRPLLKRDLQARTNRETGTPIPFRPGWDFEIPLSTHAIVEAPPAEKPHLSPC